ncbi:MAG: hypothetical protein OEY14_12485 [Myxococcales bacterium]|nr:hypothetical protein [Myxococcales bacterium]
MHARRLNLGCGSRKLPGFLNVDASPECQPDAIVDLESLPWPFEDGSAQEILLSHVLEHLGPTPSSFLGIMKELYRVCAPGALIRILVPHPRHDAFLIDPTHVRAILPETLQLFSKAKNREWRERGVANTPLALQLDVDFEIDRVAYDLDEPWKGRLARAELDRDALEEAIKSHANVVAQVEIVLRAR